MSKLEQHANALLDDIEDMFSDLLRPMRGAFKESIFSHPGFRSDGERYNLNIDLPGFVEKDLEVDVIDRAIRVRGVHKFDDNRTKSIDNVYSVPSSANVDELSAGLANGILTLSMPVKKVEKKVAVKKIEINKSSDE